MATYTVQDSQTGKNVTFEWYDNAPPTDTDLQGIFKEANKPQLQMASSHKPVTSSDITALENVKKGIWSSTGGKPIPNEWDALAGLADAARIGVNSLIAAPAKQGIEALGQLFWPREEARNIAAGVTAPMVTPIAPQAEQLTGAVSKPIEVSGNWLEQNLGYPARFTFDTAMSALPLKGMQGRGTSPGKVAPFTEAQAKAQNLAKEYDLPAFPSTLSNSPTLQGLSNVFKSKVVPMFEKTHQVVKGLLDEVRSGFKTTEEQAQFLGEKGNVYDNALAQLPGSFDMPTLRDYFTSQMDALKEVQGKRALSKNEANLLGFYERMAGKDAFSSADISEVNGKTPMPGNVKKAAMSRLYEDLKGVENGETVADVLKKTNQGYGFTKRSGIITGFLDKVMVDDRIDPARWMRLYDNFKIQNIAKMPDVFSNLDRVNDLVGSFSKELKAYNDMVNKPVPGKLETGLTRALEFGLAGTGGLPLLGLPGTLPAAGLAAAALAAKQGGGMLARSAVGPEGLLRNRMLQGSNQFGGLRDFVTQGMEETGFPKAREWGKFGPEEEMPLPTMPQAATLEGGAATTMASSEKPYSGITPGTRDWMRVWKEHPEFQQEMVDIAKKYGPATGAGITAYLMTDDDSDFKLAFPFVMGQITPKMVESLRGINSRPIKAALKMQEEINKVVEGGGRPELVQKPGKKFFEANDEYIVSADPDLLCQKSAGVDLGVRTLKSQLGDKYEPAMAWELLARAKEQGLKVACPQCYVFSARAGRGFMQKRVVVGEGAYAGEINRLTEDRVQDLQGIGLRNYSSTDFKPTHLPGQIAQKVDAANRGIPEGSYTKTTAYADIFGPTGEAINMSVGRDSNIGMPMEDALAARNKYPNVGTTYIAFNDPEIRSVLADPNIDHVIPNHLSGQKLSNLRTQLHDSTASNYTAFQNDMVIKDGKLKKASPNLKVTDPDHGGNLDAYLGTAEQRGLIPRFPQFIFNDPVLSSGTMTALKASVKTGNPDMFWRFVDANRGSIDPNYMKLIGPEYGKFGGQYPYPVADMSKVNIKGAQATLSNYLKDPNGFIPNKEVYERIANDMVSKYKRTPSLDLKRSR